MGHQHERNGAEIPEVIGGEAAVQIIDPKDFF